MTDADLTTSQRGKTPNFLVILAYYVGTGDLPFYWEGMNTSSVEMPNLKTLADKGGRFTDAHSSPLCAPSCYHSISRKSTGVIGLNLNYFDLTP